MSQNKPAYPTGENQYVSTEPYARRHAYGIAWVRVRFPVVTRPAKPRSTPTLVSKARIRDFSGAGTVKRINLELFSPN
jgi:hypothetical protein